MKNNYKISAAGIQAIKIFEGMRLKAYQDKAGVWTIGYGSTYLANGSPVKKGDELPDKQAADDLFLKTVGHYVDAVNQLVIVPINVNQGDALTSFCFNEGTGALGNSTLLKLLNKGNYEAAADEFLKWDKITDPGTGKKVVCEDLTLRRKRERLTFLKPVI